MNRNEYAKTCPEGHFSWLVRPGNFNESGPDREPHYYCQVCGEPFEALRAVEPRDERKRRLGEVFTV